jgi:hypothetical protein
LSFFLLFEEGQGAAHDGKIVSELWSATVHDPICAGRVKSGRVYPFAVNRKHLSGSELWVLPLTASINQALSSLAARG